MNESAAWKLLVIDDEEDVHQVTKLVLGDFVFDGRKLEFLHARSGAEALTLFERHPDIAVALVDVVMETEHAGLDVVRQVRERLGNKFVRLILRTGQPGAAPEREVITRYDINDYKSKAELSSLKLYSAMMTALRGYRDIVALDRQRRGMARMVEVASALFRPRTIVRFAQVAIEQLPALLELEAVIGAFYTDDRGLGVPRGTILAASGSRAALIGRPLADAGRLLYDFLAGTAPFDITGRELVVRLQSHQDETHFIYAELPRDADDLDRSLLELFQMKAVSALDSLIFLERYQAAQRQAIEDARASLPRMGQGAGHSWLDDVDASLDVASRDFPDSGW